MAIQVTMWKCDDGFLASTEVQALAYELRRQIIVLGKRMEATAKLNDFGQLDAGLVNVVANEALDLLKEKIPAVVVAVAAEVVSQGGQS